MPHNVQFACDVLPTTSENFPRGQFTQYLSTLIVLYLPGKHILHEVDAVISANFPASHLLHALAFDAFEKYPQSHGWQIDLSSGGP
jgi:hypothetical protein